MQKIQIDKNKAIVFMGCMNAMPMMYALELKRLGHEVIFFVDAPRSNTLCRPENHFIDIQYPYPNWIVELVLPSQMLLGLFPYYFARIYQYYVRKLTSKEPGCFILNGLFVSLAPYLPKNTKNIGLSHGSDLDVWGYSEGLDALCNSFNNKSIFRYLPSIFSDKLIKSIVGKQRKGYECVDTAVYFPLGFNAQGDIVIKHLMDVGVKYVPITGFSFEPLKHVSREFKAPSEKLELFSGVRFIFKTFPDGNHGYNKGNDIIIEGIAKFLSINRNVRVHFVEKGEDVASAKELCRMYGIEDAVIWHEEMPFLDLLKLYENSDICFDQVGAHWVGAIGGYALWCGKPLIANVESELKAGVWPVDNPVCSAKTSDEICAWLIKLQDIDTRKRISENSKEFADNHLDFKLTLHSIFDFKE